MLPGRPLKTTFYAAPQSVASLVAALLEPVIMVGAYLGVLVALEEPVGRADLTLCLLVFAIAFPGRNRFRERLLPAAVDVLSTWAGLCAILMLCGYATRSLRFYDGNVLLAWVLVTPALQWVAILAGRVIIQRSEALPENQRSAVVIGAGPLGVKVAQALREAGDQGKHFVGYFDDRSDDRLDAQAIGLRLGSVADAPVYVGSAGIKEVYITLPMGSEPRIVGLLKQLQDTTASIFIVPDVFGISIIQGRLQDLNGVPVVGICESPFTGINALVKRVSDLVLASLILVLVSPLMLLIAIGVKLTSPGPVVFKQRRSGLDGGTILVYKFRSMRVTEDGGELRQATRDDPRITPLGAFLRRSSLDELPQFINVLQGRMSVVGPRPHALAHNEMYRQLIQAYMVRQKVRPGITGWAQVNGHRGETDTVDKMQARVEYDLEYLRNWSLRLDLEIIARTIKLVFVDRQAY